jgi:hypothetical protein
VNIRQTTQSEADGPGKFRCYSAAEPDPDAAIPLPTGRPNRRQAVYLHKILTTKGCFQNTKTVFPCYQGMAVSQVPLYLIEQP